MSLFVNIFREPLISFKHMFDTLNALDIGKKGKSNDSDDNESEELEV